jgi:cardiolipin synthase
MRVEQELKKNRALAQAIARFFLWCQAAVLAIAAFLYFPSDAGGFAELAVYSAVGFACILALVLFNVGLFRSREGIPEKRLGTANKLTLVRFVLVVPVVVLIAHGRLIPALALYVVSGATDVADGVAARRRGEQTQFGVMMDPAADIFTTAGVFGVLYAKGLVPWWVLTVLAVRYASLFAGSILLSFIVGPISFNATPVGKIVGVLQTAAVILIVTLAAAHVEWQERIGAYLYPFLAMIFGSVIISQLVIGIRHIREGTAHVGSQGEPGRLSTDPGDADAQPRRGDG